MGILVSVFLYISATIRKVRNGGQVVKKIACYFFYTLLNIYIVFQNTDTNTDRKTRKPCLWHSLICRCLWQTLEPLSSTPQLCLGFADQLTEAASTSVKFIDAAVPIGHGQGLNGEFVDGFNPGHLSGTLAVRYSQNLLLMALTQLLCHHYVYLQ